MPQKNDEMRKVKTGQTIEDVRADTLKMVRRLQALPQNRLHVVVTFRVGGVTFACVLSGDGVKIERFD